MLGRAPKSRLPQLTAKQLQKGYDELYLPWLCPSFHRVSLSLRTSATAAQPPRRPEPMRPKTRPANIQAIRPIAGRRGLASAVVDAYSISSEESIPFANGPSFTGTFPGSFLGNPAPFLLVENPCTTAPAVFRTHNAISGELCEIHQSLHACLQVGRLERAAALMKRLQCLYKSDSSGLVAAHNEYLRELSWRIKRDKDQDLLDHLNNWFHRRILRPGVAANATTYSLMIQANLSRDDPKKVVRTVRRYLQIAGLAGLHNETLYNTMALLQDDESERLKELLPKSRQDTRNDEAVIPDAVLLETPKSHLDEVKSTPQKGLGLAALRQSLSIFSEPPLRQSADAADADQSQQVPTDENESKQRRLEKDTYDSALSRWREEHARQKKYGLDSALHDAPLGAQMWTWHEALVPLIQEEVRMANEAEGKSARSPSDKERCQYGPFLQFLPAEKLSAATILTVMTSLTTQADLEEGLKLTYLVLKVGASIQDESLAETLRSQVYRKRRQKKLRYVTDRLIKMKQRTALMKNQDSRLPLASFLDAGEKTSELVERLQWSQPIQAKVGSFLLSRLIEVAKIEVVSTSAEGSRVTERQPVFFHTFQYQAGKRQGIVRFNKAIIKRLAKEPVNSVLSKHLPMVIEPKPWTGFRSGGFLEHHIPVARIRPTLDLGRRYVVAACENGDMDGTFAGLTVLGKTPWRVNRRVFETMLAAWNTGDAIAKIPAEDPAVELPPEPLKDSIDYPAQRIQWLKRLQIIQNYKGGLQSNRCFQNFQLEIARAYVDQTFYFPHNVDFRGRAYPLSPLFNHMCADNVRGLLRFAQGKELGARGLRWLKIHLANLYGYDKASLKEREDFVKAHLSEIYDSADNPLGGTRWWLKAEDPWQCLAVCIELKDALESPDPHRFVSHIPVHQDGTCNGLQHYAALGGDVMGAKQVNLEPGDRPSDVYTAVADMVKAEIAKDAAQSDPTAQLLDGKITRKVVKQTVMTNVYGVTFRGATLQVGRQLAVIFKNASEASIDLKQSSSYIAKKIFNALKTIFNGAHDIQYWLADCASRISESLSPEQIELMLEDEKSKDRKTEFRRAPSVRKSVEGPNAFKTPVIWTNPMRMPVVQPYRNATSRAVSTNLQSITLELPSPSDPVSKRKQLQGFPPNFIHSLDASHMFLTALKCNEVGLTFASVHDSFWTHASDVDTLNGNIRDAFVEMHSEDIIQRLAAEFAVRYKGYYYFASVKSSSVIGRKIRKMRTKMQMTTQEKLEELRTERLRCTLLASKDPKEREKGMSMVTAASIFEQHANENDLLPNDEIHPGLGQLPSARAMKLQANEQLDVGDLDNVGLSGPGAQDLELAVSAITERPAVDGEAPLTSIQTEKPAKRKRPESKVRFWLPMTFPPVPKKGKFDVSRLKDSQYFFS